MPKDEAAHKRALLKRELGGRGYVIRLSTKRQDENLIARLEISDASTDASVAKIVSIANVDDLNLLVGVDAPEGVVRDVLAQLLGFADALRELVPAVTIHEE